MEKFNSTSEVVGATVAVNILGMKRSLNLLEYKELEGK